MVAGLTGAGMTGSYIFSQTIFSMRAGVKTRIHGIIIAGEHVLYLSVLQLYTVLPQEARWVWAANILSLVDLPDPSKTQSTVGTVISINNAPRQPGGHVWAASKRQGCPATFLLLTRYAILHLCNETFWSCKWIIR